MDLFQGDYDPRLLDQPRITVSATEAHLETHLDYPSGEGTKDLFRRADNDVMNTLYAHQKRLPLVPQVRCSRAETQALLKKNKNELERLFHRIAEFPFQATWMEEVACFLSHLITTQTHETGVRPLAPLGQGKNALVARGLFPVEYEPLLFPENKPPAFVLKTALQEGTDREALNEAIVGLYGLNALRKTIPHFMYVYGAYTCGLATTPKGGQGLRLCASPTTEVVYTLLETITDAMTLADYMDKLHGDPSRDQLLGILVQVVAALEVAYQEMGFMHNDLHAGNLMIRRLDRPTTLRYPIRAPGQPDLDLFVVTDALVTFIDFGRSRIRFPLPADFPSVDMTDHADVLFNVSQDGHQLFMNTGMMWTPEGVTPAFPFRLNDLVVFLTSLYTTVKGPAQRDIARFFAPLTGSDPKVALTTLHHYAVDWPPVVPFWMDVLPLDLIAAGMQNGLLDGIVFETYEQGVMPPLFRCDEAMCARSLSNQA